MKQSQDRKGRQTIAEWVPPGVSVVICCYNSAERLPETLRHLAKQQGAESIPWEVVVVDNASTDKTADVARRNWPEGSRISLRVLTEPRSGKTNALRTALQETQYEFFSIVDDDNWVAQDWVARVFDILKKRPEVAGCGGYGEPVFEKPPPAWVSRFSSSYAVGRQGQAEGYVSRERGFLYGAGLTIRRKAWQGLISGGFSEILTCRKGSSLSSGGDSEICHALILAGWKLWYDPRLTFQHYIPASRLSWPYLRRLSRGFGAAAAWLELYTQQITPLTDVRFRHLPLSEPTCLAIRRSWIFQMYATGRTLWSKYRQVRNVRNDPAAEGDAAVLRMEWEIGRAIELLKAAFVYDRTAARIRNAPWFNAPVNRAASVEREPSRV